MDKNQIIAKTKTKLIFREDNRVVKEFNMLFSKSHVLNEALNHSMVEESGLNVPKLIDVKLEGDKRSITMEYVQGKTLESMMKKDAKNINQYIDFMVDVEIEMHSKKIEGLKKLKAKYGDKICKSPYDATTRYELFRLLEKLPTHDKLCHGDFNPSNIMVDDSGNYVILDWSHATQGNASADAALTYLQFILNDKRDIAETYIETFCKKSDTAVQYVKKWLPIVAAVTAINVESEEKKAILDGFVKEVFNVNL